MEAVNTKSLFHILTKTLEKLDSAEIDVNQASAVAKLVGQCNNLLNYELKRTMVLSNPEFAKNHRNLESKRFDSLPEVR
jgi:hypothetical protein